MKIVNFFGCCLFVCSVTHLAQAVDTTSCQRFYHRVDELVDRAKVRDVQDHLVKDYPYLRSNRFVASLFSSDLSAPQFDFVLQRMRTLDLNGRRIELGNLPDTSREALDNVRGEWLPDQVDNDHALDQCGQLLAASGNHSREKMKQQVSAPTRYSLFKRIVGLYPFTAIPFARGIRKFQAEMSQSFAKPLEEVVDKLRLKTYVAPKAEAIDAAAILTEASANPLGVPLPDAQQRMQLFMHYAPNFVVDTRGEFDRPGAVRWDESGHAKVDPGKLYVYTLLSHTTVAGKVLLQLNYMIWFSERPKKGPLDMLGGALDGLIWRVTLAPDGTALLHDTIHPCGCYHLFFPSQKLRAKSPHPSLQEHAYIPQALPELKPSERLTVWIESATHYVVRVSAESESSGDAYVFTDYDELRSLPKTDGTRRSLFRPDGLVTGSERGERLLFWPMGIASAGAMRQWGHHATAFVGTRHFDDVDIIEKAFDWVMQ